MANLEQFQGTWKVISLEEDGRKRPATEVTEARVTVADNHYTLFVRGHRIEGLITRFDPTRRPRTVDFVVIVGPDGVGKKFPGIYLLEEDELTVCIARPGQERPSNFDPKPGSHCWLYLLNRVSAQPDEEDAVAVGHGAF